MSIRFSEVVYVDPTESRDVISAAGSSGNALPVLSVTYGAWFDQAGNGIGGETRPVCVRPEDVMPLLVNLGDKLRGVQHGVNPTIVIDEDTLSRMADAVVRGYRGAASRTARLALGDLIEALVRRCALLS